MMRISFPLLIFPLNGLVDGLDFYLLLRKTAYLQSLEALNRKLFHNPSHFQRIIFSLQSRDDNSIHICLNVKLCKTLFSKILHLLFLSMVIVVLTNVCRRHLYVKTFRKTFFKCDIYSFLQLACFPDHLQV